MRKLASIQKCLSIQPIIGADRIELATFLGWNVIVNKNEFKVGDLAIYIEYDSLLPVDNPDFKFLRSRCYSPKYNAYRIRCMKMKGVFSQGIVFPLSILGIYDSRLWQEGDDVTERLNIIKYDPEAWAEEHQQQNNSHDSRLKNPIIRWLCQFRWIKRLILPKRKQFPTDLVSQTDETRIQAIPFVLEEFKGTKCYISEKIDGCSFTAIMYHNKFDVYARYSCQTYLNNHWWRVAKQYDIKRKLKKLGYNNIAIQGEVIGEGVFNGSGRNLYEVKGNDLYVFNVFDVINHKQFSKDEMIEFCKKMGLKTVPIFDLYYTIGLHDVQGLLEMATGKSLLNPKEEREGIVIRDLENKTQAIKKCGDHLSFKAINPDFIMKNQDGNETV
jgi:hypothetical protein